ncbi:MAG: hypothetical protein Q8S22_01215, partial [Eubacteriales bacterium]|nr:hypothetical protein [Eubacteriales bacterium]
TFLVLDYFTAFENEKQVLSAQLFRVYLRLVLRAPSLHNRWSSLILLFHVLRLLAVALTSVCFLLYSI